LTILDDYFDILSIFVRVDVSVVAQLLSKAIGKNLTCIFVAESSD